MKKIVCLLLTLIMMAGAAASAEKHLDVQAVFSGTLEGRTLAFDLYEQEGKVYTVSDILPGCAVETDPGVSGIGPDLVFTLPFIRPEILEKAAEKADQLIVSWISLLPSETKTGIYAGDLFENAGTASVSSSSLSELSAMLEASAGEWKDGAETGSLLNGLFILACAKIQQLCPGSDPKFSIESYNGGRWIVIQISNGQDVLATVTSDRSGGETQRLLISWREAGLYYFRDITMEFSDVRASVYTELRSGPGSAYPAVLSDRPLFSEIYTLSSEEQQNASFTWIFESDALKRPLNVTGAAAHNADGTAALLLSACVEGIEKEKLSVRLTLDSKNGGEITGDTRILHFENAQENAEITLSAGSQLMYLAAELIPALPEEYQKLIRKFIFQ